mmetsp:Transcript_44019/g.89880  ORF Transcript_44019/g.89880 Transcript_44019/m.89880 type:complete len:247 (-) Transcript_44019:811-1551(-)
MASRSTQTQAALSATGDTGRRSATSAASWCRMNRTRSLTALQIHRAPEAALAAWWMSRTCRSSTGCGSRAVGRAMRSGLTSPPPVGSRFSSPASRLSLLSCMPSATSLSISRCDCSWASMSSKSGNSISRPPTTPHGPTPVLPPQLNLPMTPRGLGERTWKTSPRCPPSARWWSTWGWCGCCFGAVCRRCTSHSWLRSLSSPPQSHLSSRSSSSWTTSGRRTGSWCLRRSWSGGRTFSARWCSGCW